MISAVRQSNHLSICLPLTLNVRGPSYLGLTRSISWLLMPWLLTSPGHQQPWYWRRQDISSHDIDRVEYAGPGLTWWRILTTCDVSMWSNDIKCEYMFMFSLQNLARKGLIWKLSNCRPQYFMHLFHIQKSLVVKKYPGGRLNIKMSSYQYRNPHVKR